MSFSTVSKAALLLLTLALLVPSGQLLTAQIPPGCKQVGKGLVCKDLRCAIEAGPLLDPADFGPFVVPDGIPRFGPGVRHVQINKNRRSHTCKADIPDNLPTPSKAITFHTSLTVTAAGGSLIVFDDCSYTYIPSGKAKRTCHADTMAAPE